MTTNTTIDTVRHTELVNNFHNLEVALNTDLVERTHEIRTAILALLSRKHHFQVGPPGLAKSLLVRRLIAYTGGFPEDGYFQWLLTKYTTPEEVFGPPSLKALENDEYTRNTKHKMPRALMAFLDEIFKANSSILNALLTIMNEREFQNNTDDPSVPLMTVFAASNEMPMGEELNALWDRIHFRHEVRPVQDGGNFVKMLADYRDPNPEPIITVDQLVEAQQMVDNVKLPSDVYDQLKLLRDALKREGVEVTERRWVECLPIIRATSWLNGRAIAEIDDMKPLRFVLWSHPDRDIKIVSNEVLQLANPTDKAANDLLEDVEALGMQLDEAIANHDNPKDLAKAAVEVHGKLQKAKGTMEGLRTEVKRSGRESEILDSLEARFIQIGQKLMKDCFQVDAPAPGFKE